MAAVEVDVGGHDRVIRVRDTGDRGGRAVMFFHGTPSSRLDLHLSEPMAERSGVRLVSFDRPGYGGSTPAPFSFTSTARDGELVADRLGLERFAAFGQSSGSSYALATAAVLGERVSSVGVAAGSLRPGPPDDMDDEDKAAYALLAQAPTSAVRRLSRWSDTLVRLVQDGGDDDAIVAFFEPTLAPADGLLLRDPQSRAGAVANVRESLRQGSDGVGWDGVNRLTPWDFDLHCVRCPVFIWLGAQDETVQDATFLRDNVTNPTVVIWPDEGHLAYKSHLPEILKALTTPRRSATSPGVSC